jgi:DNA-directed RNA polymerase specialized sigma24 family protein
MTATTTAAAAAMAAAGVATTKGLQVIRSRRSDDKYDVSPLLLRRFSDESLGRRLAAGEAAAFDELYRRYSHRLAAYGAYLLGDAASGEDVAQSTLLKAYGALRDDGSPERIRPWLFRIAHNTALDLVARRRELPASDLPERAAPAPGPSPGALVEAVAALPDMQRHVYVLRELHGLRIDETGRELGLTSAQVEQALFAARNRLAEHLVFGDRLNCLAVQRLATGPLDSHERRALKTHLRSCASCRQALAASGRLSGVLPFDGLGWIRALPGLLAGGGAPAAVKVGAAVATATLAAGAPIGYEIAKEQNPRHGRAVAPVVRSPVRVVPARHRASARPQAGSSRLVADVHRAELPAAENDGSPRRRAVEPQVHRGSRSHDVERRRGGGETVPAASASRSGDRRDDSGPGSSDDGHGGSRPAATVPPPAPAVAAAPPTLTSTSGDGGDTVPGGTSSDGGGTDDGAATISTSGSGSSDGAGSSGGSSHGGGPGSSGSSDGGHSDD